MEGRSPSWKIAALIVLAGIGAWLVTTWLGPDPDAGLVPYSTLLARAEAGEIARAELGVSTIDAETRSGERLRARRLPGVEERALVDALARQHATIEGDPREGGGGSLWLFLVPALTLVLFGWWSLRALRRGPGGVGGGGFGRAEPRVVDDAKKSHVTFADVAGVDEARAELAEVVDFLRNPARYVALGARIPKGVLLVGPPGTGKTLLAKAVAGEAEVPFFSLPGSAFVELFVGVGAARMRSLFHQAVERAPCIVFIDELDAVGKRRGPSALAGNDEREQTLDQLLSEMDGFEPNAGVVLLAATNRPDMLDPALLRAGRFDRQVLVDRPDQVGREAILAVHARRLHLEGGVDLARVARRVPGMVGADLANVVNEAALAAARRGATTVAQADFDEAIDRVLLGAARRGRVMTEADRRRVACHEAGHVVVALATPHADPVERVSIIPRSIGALGVTVQLPTNDRYLLSEPELLGRLTVLLGGRAAEALVFGAASTGAEDDLAKATDIARLMVCRHGMSAALGPVALGRPSGPRFFDDLGALRDFSDETAAAIDAAIRELVETAHARAWSILEPRRRTLDALAAALIERETLARPAIDEVIALAKDGAATP